MGANLQQYPEYVVIIFCATAHLVCPSVPTRGNNVLAATVDKHLVDHERGSKMLKITK